MQTSASESFAPAPQGERLLLAIVVLIGAAVRLARLDATEAWLDEACISLFAQAPFLDSVGWVMAQESHPPLYYFLMSLWTSLFGASEFAIRMPSVLAGVASVALVWMLARQLGSRASLALAAALIYAVAPPAIYYAVEARSYSLLWALVLGAVVALHRAVYTGRRSAFIMAAALTVLATFTHYFGLMVLASWFFAVLATRDEARALAVRCLLGSLVIFAVGAGPLLARHGELTATFWLADYWHGPL
ncbi:MAG: mannosyltransferase, partial [Myxococcota bacterium]